MNPSGANPFAHVYGEHFVAVGTTGCGKTWMVKHAILSRHYRFILLDSKARLDGTSIDFKEPAFVKSTVPAAIRIAGGDKNFRLRIPVPPGDEGFDLVEELSVGLLQKNAHDCLVYLDEVTDLSDAWTVGPMLEGLVRKGRGYGISLGVGSQKPKGVNGWFMDNSAHQFIFGMKKADTTRFVRNTGAEWIATVQPKIPYGSFKFAHQGFDDRVTIWNPIPEYNWNAVGPKK